jgi:hypothetical protein
LGGEKVTKIEGGALRGKSVSSDSKKIIGKSVSFSSG